MKPMVDIEPTCCETCGRGDHVPDTHQALAIIDDALRHTDRELVSTDELRDLLLDLRSTLTVI